MLKNCEECNKVFAHPTRRLCQSCYDIAQKSFTAVKEYLLEHPGATVVEVSNETGVDPELIYEYIRDGRLSVVPKDALLLCEICGDPISSGRVCVKCRSSFRKNSYEPPESKDKPKDTKTKVHYLNQVKRH